MEAHGSATVPLRLFCFFLLMYSSLQLLLLTRTAAETTHYHDFVVQEKPVKRLCKTHRIITVNGMFPGPTLDVRNGDTLVVNVVNRAHYDISIHWHGVRQMRTGWADGPAFVTQCPIKPGGSYTYRFTVENQEGTLWWHAHSAWLRATVYGALVIRPRENDMYPFVQPKREFPILLGEWWDANPMDVAMQAARTGGAPNISDAFTINGQPGDLYRCSAKETAVIPVAFGDTVLLRVINAALNNELFFAVAGHIMTVVGADASYTRPFPTPILMLGPGQTTDVLLFANQPPARYYMAARAYVSAQGVPFDDTTTTALLEYRGSGCAPPPTDKPGRPFPPPLPLLPAYSDTMAATAFAAALRSPGPVKVPDPVDVELFFTVGLGVFPCPPGRTCGGPDGAQFAASMNNVSFVLPSTISILQAHRLGVPGVFTTDFPASPLVQFDYTSANVSQDLWTPVRGTKLLRLRYGDSVQLVLQGTSIVTAENHPIHIHGYDFYVVAEGFGNFDPKAHAAAFNLVDPPLRNTVALPVNGWAVVRFVANNPGVWLMHCHLDVHFNWGLGMAFLVEDGVEELQSLEPPPTDLPIC